MVALTIGSLRSPPHSPALQASGVGRILTWTGSNIAYGTGQGRAWRKRRRQGQQHTGQLGAGGALPSGHDGRQLCEQLLPRKSALGFLPSQFGETFQIDHVEHRGSPCLPCAG
jgi:hypothetical protein